MLRKNKHTWEIEEPVSYDWSYLQALATGSLASRASRSTKSSPPILAAPCQGLVGIPSGAVGAHCIQVPSMLLRIVVMVSSPHVTCTSTCAAATTATSAGLAVTLTALGWRTVLSRCSAVAILTAAEVVGTSPATGLAAALLGCGTSH